ncbi:putative meiosis arrest female protein [Medicago truncatula]|uniref:Putative meiosis arrest female protein n=1 Tax=Medicago truncatula TaxID=3880 RepID=A0A396IJZ8_MEDTR|nr:uncharacterized protein LOC120580232 [Medicago truncatula]RHN63257.1 putative meiosis arrest female protein [Medicago truncatula]
MFPLFLKNLSFLPSCLSRKVFTRIQVGQFSSSSSFPEVSVWWHLDSCVVPSGISYSKVAPSTTVALRANGIMGNTYGDFNSSEVDKEALNSTNFSLHGSITDSSSVKHKLNTVGKNNRYKHFLMDLNDWVSANPPPVHLFLIFASEEFSSSGILHRLRMCNYNILLACPGMPHVALCHAPTIMWD